MPRVLLIEADAATSARIETMLANAEFLCDTTPGGIEAIKKEGRTEYSIIVLEMILPDIDGIDIIRRLRAAGRPIPIIVLTELDIMADKLLAFAYGADDYMLKPFDVRELLLRIRAVLRRTALGLARPHLQVGDLRLDLKSRTLSVDSTPVKLTKTEIKIIEVLLLHPRRLITKGAMMDHLYGGIDVPGENILSVYISRIRKLLTRASGNRHYIETSYDEGWYLGVCQSTHRAIDLG